MRLYTNVNTTSTTQIAPTAIDGDWLSRGVWHVTWGENHEVYDDESEARAVFDVQGALLTDILRQDYPVEALAHYAIVQRPPRLYLHTAEVHAEYERRERALATQVARQARGLFANLRLRRAFGWTDWRDCISTGRERMERLYPDLMVGGAR